MYPRSYRGLGYTTSKPVLNAAQFSQVEKIKGPTCAFTWLGLLMIATPWIVVGVAVLIYWLS